MKKFSSILILIISFCNCFPQVDLEDSSANLKDEIYYRFKQHLGEEIPPSDLLTAEGDVYNFTHLDKKLILLDFWATWCGACVNHIQDQEEAYVRLKEQYGSSFEWINISVDKDTLAWKNMVNTKGKAGINLIGNIDYIQKTYNIEHYPTYVMLDENNKIIGFDLANLTWGPMLEYLICKGFEGVNCSDAYKSIFIPGSKKSSPEFMQWMENYYKNKEYY